MTDSKDDDSNGENNKEGKHSAKKSKPRFHSQLSNVSFGSFGSNDHGNGASGNTSPVNVTHITTSSTTFPRVSLRSILMNSPFSKRNKPRRGCMLNKHSKGSTEAEGIYLAIPETTEVASTFKNRSSLKRYSSSRSAGVSSLRRSSFGSKAQSAPVTKTKPFTWGMSSESDASSSPPTSSNISNIAAPVKNNSTYFPSGSQPSTSSTKLRECTLCLQELEVDKFPDLLTCHHSSCINCMQQYLIVEITESRVNISCPQCHQLMHPTDIHQILNNSILSYKYEDFMLRRVLSMDPDTRWCPAPDCGYAVIAAGCASCPKLKCERPGCESYFCYHCKAEWHPNQTCDMARAQRSPNAPFSSFTFLHDLQNNDDVKSCPRCQVLIVKMDDGSCNHMTCSVCSAEFCWLCMKEISDLHYLSPSGCTFWGKKPWSRKKKIMWQLGTLVGAPLGIGLVAGLAVPAMIIGIPIWVGRKIHSRYVNKGRHRRNLAMVGGVTASALISPVLAGLAVSIGVPILLAYVYGVVPISLCRSGGCGVTTSASGVRIAFDDENDMVIGIPGRQSGDPTQSTGANPSIGEVSCGASLSAESGAHLLGESDRESASTAAIAPASLTGSIASSCLSRSHRLEVQADIVHGNRSLASVDTSSLATSERSTHTLDMENASTRALAGSLLHYKVTENEGESGSMGGVSSKGGVSDSVSGVIEAPCTSIASLHHPHHATNVYMQSGGDGASTDGCSLHSAIDMRLDSVSAILKAKGVTFTDTDDEVVEDTKTFGSASSANNSVVLEMEEREDQERRGSATGSATGRLYSSSPAVKFNLSDLANQNCSHTVCCSDEPEEGAEEGIGGRSRGVDGSRSVSTSLMMTSETRESVMSRSEPSVRPKVRVGGGEIPLRRSVSVVSDVIDVGSVAMPTTRPLSKSHPRLNDIGGGASASGILL